MAELDFQASRSVPFWLRRRQQASGLFGKLQSRVKNLSTVEFVGVAALGVVLLDHFIAPKGMSFASKIADKFSGPKLPLLPPSPQALAAKGMFTGANRMAGWNRGQMDYFQWPGNVWQWQPHGGPWHNWHNEPWQFGGPEYPWAQ
jgi:hypothetical protein